MKSLLVYLLSPVWFFTFILQLSPLVSAKKSDTLQIQSVSLATTWKPGLAQEINLDILLPTGFHAYGDQFRILNIQPNNFKAGALKIEPEIQFFDKYSKKTRSGFFEKGRIKLMIEAPEQGGAQNQSLAELQNVSFDLRHQICSETVCYLPKTTTVTVQTAKLNTPNEVLTAPVKESFSLLKSFESAIQSNILLAFLFVFLAGVLTSFTPCIFPMLPITISILGYHANQQSRWHNFSRALAYVFGIALTYSSLGVVAALTGSLFGSALTNKYVISSLVLLFFAMALSMWGVFEIQSPAFIRNRFGTGKSHSLGSSFIMGLVAGIVASPCVGPVLVSILSYVSTTKDALLGFGLLFTFAMGLGLLFIVIGLFSSALKLLPRSGAWMELIKFILGAGMWGAALYYSQFLLSDRWWTALIAASFVALSVWKGAFQFRKNYIRQSFMLALFTFSFTVLLLSFFKPQYLTSAFQLEPEAADSQAMENQPRWLVYSEEALAEAQRQQKPVMIDFFAEWCGACHELERKTFSTPQFKQLAEDFYLLRFDATEDNEQIQAVLRKYDVKGLPTVIFINRNGVLLHNLTFTQFLEITELAPKMQEALK